MNNTYKLITTLTLTLTLAACGDNSDMYAGDSISRKFDAQNTCQTARMMAKGKFTASQKSHAYSSLCTVKKLTSKLPGRFSMYTPYAVTWSNDIAIRVFETSEGLRMMGYSDDGVPFSWNDDHKDIAKTVKDLENECTEIFEKKTSVTKYTITESLKYDDKSGAKVKLEYIDKNGVPTTGGCNFDRVKMVMATSKIAADKYSKYVYKNL